MGDNGPELEMHELELAAAKDRVTSAVRQGKRVMVSVGYKSKAGSEAGVVRGSVDTFDVANSLQPTDQITGVAFYFGPEGSLKQPKPIWKPAFTKKTGFLFDDGKRSEDRLLVNSLNINDLASIRIAVGAVLDDSIGKKVQQNENIRSLLRGTK